MYLGIVRLEDMNRSEAVMLEAVNSVISNASLLRGQAEQASPARSLAANPESVQVVAQAPYISPYITIDINYDTAVLALRDRDTGDFLTTIPSDAKLAARARDETRRAQDVKQQQTAESGPTVDSSAPDADIPEAPQAQTPQPQVAPEAFSAFSKQVASLQTAIAGGSTGGMVSLSA